MPLIKGSSDEDRSKNIGELRRSGYPAKQAEAIAYREQRESKGRKGGKRHGRKGSRK